MNIELLILALLIGVFITPFLLCVMDHYFGTSYSCRFWSWHNGKGMIKKKFDGCSVYSICSKCGKEVMQDSQGNWF